jgi:hypothetical protein
LFAIDAATAIAQQIGGKNYEIAIRLFYLSRLPVVINTIQIYKRHCHREKTAF